MTRLPFHSRISVGLLLVALASLGLASARAAEPDVAEVKIDNFTMTPHTITVKAGTSVRWTNADDIPHTVVSDDRAFKSEVMDTGGQYAHTFDKAGTYGYFCSIHPKMTGTIVVK